jgi:hypothetical protein
VAVNPGLVNDSTCGFAVSTFANATRHEDIATTLSAYCPVSTTRLGELIRAME